MKSSVPVSRIFTAAKRRNIPSEWFCPNSMNPLCSKSNERKRVRLTLRESPLTSESNNSIHPSGGPIQSSRHKKRFMTKRHFLIAAVLLLSISSAFAQGNGLSGINQATNMVTSYFDPATKLIYAIGAVVGLIGGVKVYSKFSSGDPDTSKTAASWFGACIFLIVAATILRSFFL